jgi:predicted metal-dependent hydrolase
VNDTTAGAREQPPDVDPESFDFVRRARARRYILRVRPDGGIRVTVPRGGSRAEARRFVEKHTAWIRQERLRVRAAPELRRWGDGTVILLHGEPTVIRLLRHGSEMRATYANRSVRIPPDAADLRPHVERDLRVMAAGELVPRLRELAAAHALAVSRVTIRNQRSRWGSCTRRGGIALNFRLVQMPPAVSDYVLLHELMHLKQQNHSLRFWRLVEQVCPAFLEAEHWLKTEGRSLF